MEKCDETSDKPNKSYLKPDGNDYFCYFCDDCVGT